MISWITRASRKTRQWFVVEIDFTIRFAIKRDSSELSKEDNGKKQQRRRLRGPRKDNDPVLISRSFYLIDLISPGPEQADR